jgi:Rho termination factor, N-terminal domain
MAQTYEELKKKTIDELREIAKGIDNEAVKGYTQMNKEHLLPAICKALGIDTHVHHPQHAKPGVDKAPFKTKLRQLKAERDKALEAHDHARLKAVRRQMHGVNRKLRAASA